MTNEGFPKLEGCLPCAFDGCTAMAAVAFSPWCFAHEPTTCTCGPAADPDPIGECRTCRRLVPRADR